jgi:very-short-patch-repair endonuclease
MREYNRTLKGASRELRKQMTDAERALWRRLRRKQIHGLQFYRQKPLLSFVVDFYCPAAKLVIEVDGGQHGDVDHQSRDRERDRRLIALGLRVLRFDNRQVLGESEAVLDVIQRAVQARAARDCASVASDHEIGVPRET